MNSLLNKIDDSVPTKTLSYVTVYCGRYKRSSYTFNPQRECEAVTRLTAPETFMRRLFAFFIIFLKVAKKRTEFKSKILSTLFIGSVRKGGGGKRQDSNGNKWTSKLRTRYSSKQPGREIQTRTITLFPFTLFATNSQAEAT